MELSIQIVLAIDSPDNHHVIHLASLCPRLREVLISLFLLQLQSSLESARQGMAELQSTLSLIHAEHEAA